MNLTRIVCRTCGAPLDILPNADQVTCSYCQSRMAIERGPHQAPAAPPRDPADWGTVDGESVDQEMSGYTDEPDARSIVDRLAAGQELSSVEARLVAIQGEMRALERDRRTRTARRQTRDLAAQERALQARAESLRAALSDPARPAYGLGAPAGAARSWFTALVLCLTLGMFGAHRFYTGHTAVGIAQLLTLGMGGLWWLVDLVLLLSGRYRDSHGRPLLGRETAGGVGCAWGAGVYMAVGALMVVILADGEGPIAALLVGAVAGAVALAVQYRRARRRQAWAP